MVSFFRSVPVRETTGAYLLPSAGLSTAHLHIDGKSMGSLHRVVDITNDQFKLSHAAFQKEALAQNDESHGRPTSDKKSQFSLIGADAHADLTAYHP